jgi:hypothetical protein
MTDDRRCIAKSKVTGKQCGRKPIPGGLVCGYHGGKAPQVAKKAAERVAKQNALQEARRMMQVEGDHMSEVEHLLYALHRAFKMSLIYGEMLAGLDEAGELMVQEGDEPRRGWARRVYVQPEEEGAKGYYEVQIDPLLTAGKDKYHTHPYVGEFNHWCQEHARIAKLCIDVNVEERRVKATEDVAQEFIRLMEASFDRLGLPPEKKQQERLAIAQDSLRLSG